MHYGDAQELGELLEDGVLGEGGGIPLGVGVAQALHAGPIVQLAGVTVVLKALHPLVTFLASRSWT